MGMWARMNDWGTLANAFGIIMTCEIHATASVHKRILPIEPVGALLYPDRHIKLMRYCQIERNRKQYIIDGNKLGLQ